MVYISSAIMGLSDREIGSIVRAARVNNGLLNISGILLYNSRNFMQLIEGEEEVVEALYKKISIDRRHTNITLLLKEKITHRNFEQWEMGFKKLDSFVDVDPEISNHFLNEDANAAVYKNNPYRALQFLETFKKITL